MQVLLIKRDKLFKLALPREVNGSYWLMDKDEYGRDRELINIEEEDSEWKLKSNSDCKIINVNGDVIDNVLIDFYTFNYIRIKNEDSISLIYCCPQYDETFVRLNSRNIKELIVGNDTDCHIIYNTKAVSNKHVKLSYENSKWTLTDLNSVTGVYVNDIRMSSGVLYNGDVVFIMGLKLIIMGDILLVNNPSGQVRINNVALPIAEEKKQRLDSLEEIEGEVELYEENEYFFKSPRIKTVIEKEVMVIDSPPGKQQVDDTPMIYVIGPMMTMGMMSMMTMFTSLQGVWDGTRELSSAMPSLIVSTVMLTSMILWPLLNRKYQKKKKEKYEKERQEKYSRYIAGRGDEIDLIMKKQKQILIENYIPVSTCENIIISRNRQLWERNIEHDDFLSIRLGIGNVPLDIDIKYPEEHFTMDEDNLRDIIGTLVNKSKMITGVPVSLSLTEKYISAIIGKSNEAIEYMKKIILQLVTFHSYEDLKLVFFVNQEHAKEWEYVKILPHVWSNDKQMRFFATEYEEMKEVSAYLDRILQSRIGGEGNNQKDYKGHTPYYILITDNYREAKSLEVIANALKQKTNIGFNVIVMNDNLSTLPNECSTFISINNNKGGLFESELTSTNQKEFVLDDYQNNNLLGCCYKLANIPIKFANDMYALPNSYSFLELYNVGKIEQLNALNRWKMSNATLSLQAPVGVDAHGMPFRLDVHEKVHGPHGLIAGMTGSGKSEFIITYILSLATNYHPDDVSFILIDYKGGGLAGAFKNEDTGVKLPHLAGTITNLDTAEMQRALVSIQSELRRRQAIFNDAREALNEGTIDIYKYQKFYHEGLVKDPLPHLLIISDEFAELKAQQPEFMDQLISTARIGRSLGVHLILATQKPSGVVNDQIWSNARFRICLKVQDKSDSMDMIKVPDAAALKQTGRFFLQVGYNEYFGLGQSAWCGAQYVPTEKVVKKVDDAINYINNIGAVFKEVTKSKGVVTTAKLGEQLPNIVKYLSELAEKGNITVRQLWLDKIASNIYIENLKKKYKHIENKCEINPIIGEYDDPFNQYQGLLTLPLSKDGNAIIYGSSSSGKELTVNALIYSGITNHSSEELNFYILEFGSESLKMFVKAPHVGDILFAADEEKISNFFKMIQKEIDNRKKEFSDYNGDYSFYVKSSGKIVPTIVVIINNYEAFNEMYSNYEDTLLQLTREGHRYGIVFILTTSASNMIRYRLAQNFKQKIVLQLNDTGDYSSILGNVKKTFPSEFLGRGIVNLGSIYEFQTAQIVKEEQLVEDVRNLCEELKNNNTFVAKKVPTLPDKVTIDFMKEAYKNLSTVPIGIDKKDLEIQTYNFKGRCLNTVTSVDITLAKSFIDGLSKELLMLNNVDLFILDTEGLMAKENYPQEKFFVNGFDEICTGLLGKVRETHEYYKNNNFDVNSLTQVKQTFFVIIGLEKFLSRLSEDNKKALAELFTKSKETAKFNYVVIDNVDRIKKVEYEEWYRSSAVNNCGIWLGNGITDQFVIKLTKTTRDLYEEIGNNFGYLIDNGSPILVKLLDESSGGNDE